MATLNELKDRVLHILSAIEDSEFDESRDMELVVDGISTAHDAILPWIPKKAQIEIPSGTTVYELPDGVYDIQGIMDETAGEVINQLVLEPGVINLASYWFPFPEGSVTFSEETQNALTMFYLTYWDKPSEEADLDNDMEPPDMCLVPMTYFATAYVLMPDSVQTAEIRQFNVKADSGNPEDNPIEKMVKFLLTMFRQDMDSLPSYQRSRR